MSRVTVARWDDRADRESAHAPAPGAERPAAGVERPVERAVVRGDDGVAAFACELTTAVKCGLQPTDVERS